MNGYNERAYDVGSVDSLEKPEADFNLENIFDYALITVDNKIARARTKWSCEEIKLFYLSVSKLQSRDKEGWVMLPKADIISLLGIDARHTNELRRTFVRVRDKSQISLTSINDEAVWEEGFLIYKVRSDRKNIYVKFDTDYMPYLEGLQKAFTAFYPENIAMLKSKAAIDLYLYLISWSDSRFVYLKKRIRKKDISQVFHLEKGQYWRNYNDPETRKFHWADFERWCLKPAIEAINSTANCDITIDRWTKVKHPRSKIVLGYEIDYRITNPDGTTKIAGVRWKPDADAADKPSILMMNSTEMVRKRLSKFKKSEWARLAELWDLPTDVLQHFLTHPDSSCSEHYMMITKYADKQKEINELIGFTDDIMGDFFQTLEYERAQNFDPF